MDFSAHQIADYAAFITAVIVLIGSVSYFFLRNTKTTQEVVDGPVLVEFRQLLERVVALELRLAGALDKIGELEDQESDLKQKVSRREERILLLERENEKLTERVSHLEEVCRAAGINGDDLNGTANV